MKVLKTIRLKMKVFIGLCQIISYNKSKPGSEELIVMDLLLLYIHKCVLNFYSFLRLVLFTDNYYKQIRCDQCRRNKIRDHLPEEIAKKVEIINENEVCFHLILLKSRGENKTSHSLS